VPLQATLYDGADACMVSFEEALSNYRVSILMRLASSNAVAFVSASSIEVNNASRSGETTNLLLISPST